MLGTTGIDLHAEEQLTRLASWTSERHQALFKELRADPTLRLDDSFYTTPDAEIYAAMILDRNPRRIVEVGAGYAPSLPARRSDTPVTTPSLSRSIPCPGPTSRPPPTS